MRRLILSPRWIVWHVLTLGAMLTCGWLAAWQWERAGSAMGSALNVGYGLQWPVFAIFFGVMWWRMLRMEVADLKEAGEDAPVPAEEARSVPEAPAPVPTPRPADASPFGPRPVGVAAPTPDDPEMVEYNRMLADLAARPADR